MLIPFDMIAVMLFLGYYAETPVPNPPEPAWACAMVLLHAAGLFAAAALINRLALFFLARRQAGFADRRRVAAGVEVGLRALLLLVYADCLIRSALPWSVAQALGWRMAAGDSFVMQLLGLAPFLLLFFCAWFPLYGLHRETGRDPWTRWAFLLHKARYNLFMLLAWLPFAFLADWFSGFLLAIPILFLLAAWTFPLLLAKIWGCKPLGEGETLDMVRRLERKTGAGFSRVYLWEPEGGVQNAAAVGIFRPFRYLFLTPALIRGMRPPELEAVILHELGHVRKKHLLFYLATSLAGINLAVFISALAPLAGSGERFAVAAILILAYFRLAFGWLSRSMERQADLFALENTTSERGLPNALEKLAIAAGNIRLADSWHHLGIAQRVDFLRRTRRDAELGRRHHRRVFLLMLAGYGAAVLVVLAMAWVVAEEYGLFPAPPPAPRSVEGEAHWRRVMRIMPEHSTPALELAYLLAGGEKGKPEATALAEQAMRLTRNGEEKAAAAKLLADMRKEAARLGRDGE